MGSTHTTGTIRAISSGFFKGLLKITSLKPSFHSEGVDTIYLKHANALHEVGLEPSIISKMGEI